MWWISKRVSKYCLEGLKAIATSKTGASVNEEIDKELNKPVINKFNRKRVYSKVKDNIWAADLAEMGWLSSKNRGVKYLLCVIDVFTKHSWIKPLEDKNAKTVIHGFIGKVNESKSQPKKLWVDQGR